MTPVRNGHGSNSDAAHYGYLQYDLRFPEYYRQGKCALRLPKNLQAYDI